MGGGWVFLGVVGEFVDAGFLSSKMLPIVEMFIQTFYNFFANLAFSFSPILVFTHGWAFFGQLIFCPNTKLSCWSALCLLIFGTLILGWTTLGLLIFALELLGAGPHWTIAM